LVVFFASCLSIARFAPSQLITRPEQTCTKRGSFFPLNSAPECRATIEPDTHKLDDPFARDIDFDIHFASFCGSVRNEVRVDTVAI
jgi:hypothetical protein